VPTVAELLTLASRNHQAGNLQAAEQLFLQILQADASHAEAHFQLGNIALRQRKPVEAASFYRRALEIRQDDAEAHCNLGLAFAAQGKLEEAVDQFREALRLNPKSAEAHNNLGVSLRSLGKSDEAMDCFQSAIGANPGFAEAQGNLGNALNDRGQLDEAVDHYRQALRLNPNNANVHNNLGGVLQRQHLLEEAIAHYGHALRIKPHHAAAHRNLGLALQTLGNLENALAHFQQAIGIQPSMAEAHHDRALLWLLQSNFEQGWPEYEWRFNLPRRGRRPFPKELWDGSPLEGKTILLHAEQGLGDTLHFIRYVPLVTQMGGSVIVECQPALLQVLATAPGLDRLVARGSPLPCFDVHAPLLSLPGIFHSTLATLPAEVPYLYAKPELVERWKRELADLAPRPSSHVPGFKVGIAWQGNPEFLGDHNRSIRLAHFSRLAQVSGVQFISLQKGPGIEQLRNQESNKPILDFSNVLDEDSGPFMDTAALMKCVDLVISADTAVAHLAGALGVPVWVALPQVPDWRWLLDRDDSPWYSTMRLFRQRQPGNWEDVFVRIAANLRGATRATGIRHG
jgi:tetratricopeptide (TPR) repeat protein